MRHARSAKLLLAGVLLLLPVALRAQKLDDDDKKFLADVQPLLLPAERSAYEKLQDKADRREFQRIFWARRDPNLGTTENEFQQQYYKDRATADESFRVAGRAGSFSDCGRTLILLGKPDEVQHRPSRGPTAMEAGARVPEVWIYKDRPDRRVEGGKVMVAFDSECRAEGDFAQQFGRMAAARILHPDIDYKVGKDGRLVTLADQLPRDTRIRAVLQEARQEFALAFQPAYFKVASGATALLGLVEGDAGGLVSAESGGAKTVNVSVAARAHSADGKEAGWTEQAVNAPVGANGRFLASFKMGLKPGKYTLRTGALDLKGAKASTVSVPIEVPDFSQVTTAADGSTKPQPTGTVLVLKDIKESAPNAPEDPADPFAAFRLSTARLIPVFTASLHKSDSVIFFFQLYDLQVDPATGRANGSVRLKLMKEGGAVVNSSSETPVWTAVFSTGIGPVPLAGFPPRRYLARVEATDKIAQKTIAADAAFEIQP